MTRHGTEQDGGILAMVMLAWLVLAGLAFAAVTMVAHETRARVSETRRWQAFYLAQAGVERAVASLAQDVNHDWSDNPPGMRLQGKLGSGTYVVTVTPIRKDRALLTATGTSAGELWTVKAVVAIDWGATTPRVSVLGWEEPHALQRLGL